VPELVAQVVKRRHLGVGRVLLVADLLLLGVDVALDDAIHGVQEVIPAALKALEHAPRDSTDGHRDLGARAGIPKEPAWVRFEVTDRLLRVIRLMARLEKPAMPLVLALLETVVLLLELVRLLLEELALALCPCLLGLELRLRRGIPRPCRS